MERRFPSAAFMLLSSVVVTLPSTERFTISAENSSTIVQKSLGDLLAVNKTTDGITLTNESNAENSSAEAVTHSNINNISYLTAKQQSGTSEKPLPRAANGSHLMQPFTRNPTTAYPSRHYYYTTATTQKTSGPTTNAYGFAFATSIADIPIRATTTFGEDSSRYERSTVTKQSSKLNRATTTFGEDSSRDERSTVTKQSSKLNTLRQTFQPHEGAAIQGLATSPKLQKIFSYIYIALGRKILIAISAFSTAACAISIALFALIYKGKIMAPNVTPTSPDMHSTTNL
uniref:Uncharacterized protein n=1 Tax=Ascaris lumbricoides TaxID=6252 RepID=A0A0M3HV93_ASCLU